MNARKMFFVLAILLGNFFYSIPASAATYYMPDNFVNLQEAFSNMSGGDELIIRDGTYTGAANEIHHTQKPPNGTSANYTTVRAEHPGKVIFQDVSCEVSATNYIHYDGLLWHRITSGKAAVTVSSATHPTYIKFTKCGVWSELPLATAGRDDAFVVNTCDYVLLEDCYAYGNFRYGFYVGKSANAVVVRRCVARLDGYNTETDMSTFMVYDAHNVEIQNCIGIDIDSPSDKYLHLGSVRAPHLVYYRQTSEGYDTENVNFVGSIFLNVNGKMIGGSSATDVNFINTVFWDGVEGIRHRNGGASGQHLTIGNISGSTTWSDGWYSEQHTDPILDSIITSVTNRAGLRGSRIPSDYNDLYNNATNYADATIGAHDMAIDPSLLYLVRVEDSSPLKGQASDGGDIGARILYKIGVSGTMYGEPGYNTITTEYLWPFPNEDLIDAKMRSFNFEGISGARGFCAGGQTLTKYIWEYLGNPIPPEIYGGEPPEPDTTAPVISNVGAGNITATSATISWTTNESATSRVDYGETTGYGQQLTQTSLTTSHQLALSGLQPNTTYHYKVTNSDSSNNSADSADFTFTTEEYIAPDTTAPVISNVGTNNITTTSATITWTTDEQATGLVDYGETAGYGQQQTQTSLTTSHQVALSGLQPNTTYHYKVTSFDSSNNSAATSDFTFTTQQAGSGVTFSTLQDFENGILWSPGGGQDPTGNGRGWAFLNTGSGDTIEIDNIGANNTNRSLKITFASSNDTLFFRSNDKITDHMPEAAGANRMSFYVRFPAGFPIQPLPFRYDTWQLGTYIHDPGDWSDTHRATSEGDHGIHHYYHRLTVEQAGDGWVKYIVTTQPDQANYSGSTVPPDRGAEYFNNFGRFYLEFGPEAGGPAVPRPFTIWLDEIKFYHDDGSVGGQIHVGGQDDAGFDGEFIPDSSGGGGNPLPDTTPPAPPTGLGVH